MSKVIVKEVKIVGLANYSINVETEKVFLRNSIIDGKIIQDRVYNYK